MRGWEDEGMNEGPKEEMVTERTFKFSQCLDLLYSMAVLLEKN